MPFTDEHTFHHPSGPTSEAELPVGFASSGLNATSLLEVLTCILGSTAGKDALGRQATFNAPTDFKLLHLKE